MPTAPDNPTRPRICFVVSAPETASSFLNPHIEALAGSYDVTVVANFLPGGSLVSGSARQFRVPIRRKPHPLQDLKAWLELIRFFRRSHFTAVHSVTPKAGLLGMSAAWVTRVPNRFHWYTGQLWVTRHGLSRRLFKAVDRFIGSLTTATLADSVSQRDFVVDQRVIKAEKIEVLGRGSICGVDSARFAPNPASRDLIRRENAISEDTIVILFLGRLTRDKGVVELSSAFSQLDRGTQTHLIFVGPDEENLSPLLRSMAEESGGSVSIVGRTSTPEVFMAAADIFCLPSHREGFGLSVIEAASCGVPSVASNIYGLSDAVQDGITGLLFPPSDINQLAESLQALVGDAALRQRLGQAARSRVINDFGQQRLTAALVQFYEAQVQLMSRVLVLGTTIPLTAAVFLKGQMEHLRDEGWEVNLVTSPGPELEQIAVIPGIKVRPISMERGPSPASDIRALRQWVGALREIRPDIVMSGTPKSGLIGMLSAWIVRTPTRIYLVRGLRLEGLSTRRDRVMGTLTEYLACASATSVIAVSQSLRAALVRRHLVSQRKVLVLGNGGSHGVDTRRFTPPTTQQRENARERWGIDSDAIVVGFAGRLTANKGVVDLVMAMASVVQRNPAVILVMAGEPDGTDPLTETTLNDLDQPWIMRLGPLTHMPEFYAALDIFCLPSHREGFPNVNLEAAATGLPVVTTTATGCIDSVRSGVDGILVPPQDPNALALAIEELVRDSSLRNAYGQQGRDRVIELFDERRINSLLAATLDDLAQSSVRRHGSSKRGQASR